MLRNFIYVFIFLCLYHIFSFISNCYSKDNVLPSLKIGAFNIQNLGVKKFSNEEIVNIIRKIILHYDIIFVQEIVTRDQNLIKEFLYSINTVAPKGIVYDVILSKRLGRNKAKEQYAYFYRSKTVSVLHEEEYPDKEDKFMRPPYIAHFQTPTIENLQSFIAIGIHTQPSNAVNEIVSLQDVYNYAMNKYRIRDAIIMGDMNAACSSVPMRNWKEIRNIKIFTWLIDHDIDTTTNANTCSYDKIIITGEKIKKAIIPNSAGIFDFQKKYRLSLDQTRNISDHWPVEVRLKGKHSFT